MEYAYVGKVVNTHGIKGEIRIKSYFEHKDKVFIPNHYIYIGEEFEKYKILTHRVHKDFDMVTLEGYNNINDVLFLLKKNVYVLKDDLNLKEDEFLLDELIGFGVYVGNALKGAVSDIYLAGPKRHIMDVETENGIVKVPFHKDLIKGISKEEKKIELEMIEGMFV